MEIQINGQQQGIPDNTTVQALIERLGLAGQRVAMEINGEILPRSRYAQYILQATDRVEIVNAVGGG